MLPVMPTPDERVDMTDGVRSGEVVAQGLVLTEAAVRTQEWQKK
jgi:hypothetical protein